MQRDDRMQQEGGVNCCVLSLRFLLIILRIYHNKIKLKLKVKKIKVDKYFTWKPSWPNKKEKPRPSGFQNSYYVLGNQLQSHKTICFT